MKTYSPLVLVAAALMPSCATMNESVQLGATVGGLTGAAAVYGGQAAAGTKTSLADAAIGAGVGTVLGVISSYLIHGSVEERRASLQSEQTEMHFGDLPPSPFIVPNRYPVKKGVR